MHIVTIVICSASPLKLVLSFGMDGPNVNKSILGKLDEKKEKCFKPLVRCSVVLFMRVTIASAKE